MKSRTLSMRWLLIGQFALVLALATITVVLMMLFWRLPLAREQQQLEQMRATAAIAHQVESRLDSVEQLVLALAHLPPHAHPYTGPDAATHQEPALQHLAQELARRAAFFQAFYWLDARGHLLGWVWQQPPTVASALARPGADLSNLALFQELQQGGAMVWSDQYLSPLLDKPVVALGLLQPDQSRILIAEISVQHLIGGGMAERLLEDHVVLVTDGKGELVSAPDALAVQHRKNIANQELIATALRGAPTHGRMQFQGQTIEGCTQRIERIGWVIFSGQPLLQARSQEIFASTVTAVAVLVAVAFGLFFSSLVAALISRQLGRSVAYADAVARGDYRAAPPASPIEEVRRLEASLGTMVTEVQRREQRFRAIIEHGPAVAVQIYDRDTRVLDWNPASEHMLGYSRSQALGQRPVDLYYDAQQQADFEALLARIAATGAPHGPTECVLRHADGTLRWIYATTFAIPGPTPDAPHFVCMDIDISQLKRLETELRQLNEELERRVQARTRSLEQANAALHKTLDELRQTQNQLLQTDKLAALGSLVAGVAHELNTPIGNALMAVSTLQERHRRFLHSVAAGLRRSELDAFVEQVGTAHEIAARNLQRATELISSFKQVAVDQTSSQRRRFELAEVVHEIALTLQPLFKRSPHRLEIEVPGGIWLDSYPGPLGQALTNLIQNALSHGIDGQSAGVVQIQALAQPAQVRLGVRDNGRGIPFELQERIFEPFYTTRLGRGGSGLGLHIVHNLVTGVLGGRVELDSSPGQGACFTLVLPLQAPQERAAVPGAPGAPGAPGTRSVQSA